MIPKREILEIATNSNFSPTGGMCPRKNIINPASVK